VTERSLDRKSAEFLLKQLDSLSELAADLKLSMELEVQSMETLLEETESEIQEKITLLDSNLFELWSNLEKILQKEKVSEV